MKNHDKVFLLILTCFLSINAVPPRSILKKQQDPKKRRPVAFAEKEIVHIIPVKVEKRMKPGSLHSPALAPLVLKEQAKALLIALEKAKGPIVFSPCDETTHRRSLRSELKNARLRRVRPENILAAQDDCKHALAQLKVAAISKTRVNPVERAEAFNRGRP